MMNAETPFARVSRLDAPWPMPEGEMRRLDARRWILTILPKGGVGAEIGVFRGHFSAQICGVAQPRKLYLVDPWTVYGPTFDWPGAYTNDGKLPTATARDQAVARVAQYPSVETVVIEGYYPAVAPQIAEPLDFAYLDSSHKYEDTLVELRHLQTQVKPGGLILGDDWMPDPGAVHHGVFRAVQDFVQDSDWQIMVAGPGAQWAIRRKPAYA